MHMRRPPAPQKVQAGNSTCIRHTARSVRTPHCPDAHMCCTLDLKAVIACKLKSFCKHSFLPLLHYSVYLTS